MSSRSAAFTNPGCRTWARCIFKGLRSPVVLKDRERAFVGQMKVDSEFADSVLSDLNHYGPLADIVFSDRCGLSTNAVALDCVKAHEPSAPILGWSPEGHTAPIIQVNNIKLRPYDVRDVEIEPAVYSRPADNPGMVMSPYGSRCLGWNYPNDESIVYKNKRTIGTWRYCAKGEEDMGQRMDPEDYPGTFQTACVDLTDAYIPELNSSKRPIAKPGVKAE